MDNIELRLTNLEKDLTEIKSLILNNNSLLLDIKDYLTQINLSPTNSNEMGQIIDFIILEKGFNLDNSSISICLNKNNIVGDIKLFKNYYFKSNFKVPIRKVNTKYEYYNNDSWINNENSFIEKVILTNIINTYLEFIKNDNDKILIEDKSLKLFTQNIEYIKKLETNKKYRKTLIDEILRLF